jgi:hypothetical protein
MMRFLVTLLLAAAMVLGYLKLEASISAPADAPTNVLGLEENRVDIAQLESIGAYASIIDLPLFDPTRRPPQVEVKLVESPKPVVKQLKIQAIGIAVTSDHLLAVVKDLSTGKILRLRIGDSVEDWSLSRVSEDSLVFVRDGNEKIVQFKK